MLKSIDLPVLPPTAGCSCAPCRLKPLVPWLKHHKNSVSATLRTKSLTIRAWLCQKLWQKWEWETSFRRTSKRPGKLPEEKNVITQNPASLVLNWSSEFMLLHLLLWMLWEEILSICWICFLILKHSGLVYSGVEYPGVASPFKGQAGPITGYAHFIIPEFLSHMLTLLLSVLRNLNHAVKYADSLKKKKKRKTKGKFNFFLPFFHSNQDHISQ